MNKNKIIIFLLVQVAGLYSSHGQQNQNSSPKKRENLWLALRIESYKQEAPPFLALPEYEEFNSDNSVSAKSQTQTASILDNNEGVSLFIHENSEYIRLGSEAAKAIERMMANKLLNLGKACELSLIHGYFYSK